MKQNDGQFQMKSFGDVASFRRGLTYAKEDVADNTSKIVLRSNNITLETSSLNLDDIVCLKDDFAIPTEKKLHKGDIFICMSNGSTQHLGKVAYISNDLDMAFGGFMGVIEPKRDFVSPRYLFYSCRSGAYRSYLNSIFNGANINNLKWSDLSKFEIPVPPMSEQSRIVAELDLLTGIIDKQNAQLKELDNLAQSIFYDMFGDPMENHKGFEVKTIREVCTLKSGDSSANNSKNGCLPYVKVGDMNLPENETFITTSSTFVDRESNKKAIFPIGTTIFPKRGGAIYTNKKRLTAVEICCDLNTMGVIPGPRLMPRFVFQYFLGIDFGKICNGAAIPQLNNCDIGPLNIPVPPLKLQQEFADKITAIENQKSAINQSMADTQKLLDYTMDKYFG